MWSVETPCWLALSGMVKLVVGSDPLTCGFVVKLVVGRDPLNVGLRFGLV